MMQLLSIVLFIKLVLGTIEPDTNYTQIFIGPSPREQSLQSSGPLPRSSQSEALWAGPALYLSCDCVNCDEIIMIASQPWCRCCAQAFMVECNRNTSGDDRCMNSKYSMEYCMEKNFWSNCPIARCPLTEFPDAVNHYTYTSNYTSNTK